MITKELIQQNIPSLTDESTISQVVELANNTFNKELEKEVNTVRGSTFGLIDETLKDFGYPKQSGKTTEHLKNVLLTMKESQMDDKTKNRLSELERTNKELSELVKSGNPDFSKKEKDLLDKINLLDGSLKEKESQMSKMQQDHKKNFIKLKLNAAMPKIKESIPEETKELHTTHALNEILELADLDESGNVIFRNEKGEILYNPANKNNPFAAKEMFENNKYFKAIMDDGQKTKGVDLNKYEQNQKSTITLTNVKTQLEANEVIEKMILAKGITKTDVRFQQEVDKIYKDNKINELPMR